MHISFNRKEIENPIMTLENSLHCAELIDLIKEKIN